MYYILYITKPVFKKCYQCAIFNDCWMCVCACLILRWLFKAHCYFKCLKFKKTLYEQKQTAFKENLSYLLQILPAYM